MEQNYFILDPIPGSISNIYDIKILICCLLFEVKKPVPQKMLNDVFQQHEVVNYFNFCQGVSELLKTKHLTEENDEDGYAILKITDLGKETATTLKKAISPAAFEKCLKTLTLRLKEDWQNKDKDISIKEVDDGFLIKFSIKSTSSNLMDLTLFASNENDAKKLADECRKKTTDVYLAILAVLQNDDQSIENISENIKNMKNNIL